MLLTAGAFQAAFVNKIWAQAFCMTKLLCVAVFSMKPKN